MKDFKDMPSSFNGESMEVRFARAEERWKMVHEELAASREARKHQYEAMDLVRNDILKLTNTVSNVETQLASNQPTIQEFITIKHKVVGAGALGKWLWAAGAFLIGVAATSREAIFHWFSKGS